MLPDSLVVDLFLALPHRRVELRQTPIVGAGGDCILHSDQQLLHCPILGLNQDQAPIAGAERLCSGRIIIRRLE